VLFIINNSIGLITPPVGTVLNVVCGVSKISMDDIIKGVLAVHDRATSGAVPPRSCSRAGDGAGEVVRR
jgi:hypothetical protein